MVDPSKFQGLVGKQLSSLVELERQAKIVGFTRVRVWRPDTIGDCQMDLSRLNLHIDGAETVQSVHSG